MTEWLMILCMALGGTLFAIGGTGFKWVRRWILPISLGIVAWICGLNAFKCLLGAISLIISLSLPYGEKVPHIAKIGVFSAIYASTLWFGFSWWQPVGILVCFTLFRISNTKWGQNIVMHKIWEFTTGAMLGIIMANIIAKGG